MKITPKYDKEQGLYQQLGVRPNKSLLDKDLTDNEKFSLILVNVEPLMNLVRLERKTDKKEAEKQQKNLEALLAFAQENMEATEKYGDVFKKDIKNTPEKELDELFLFLKSKYKKKGE